MSNFDVTRSRVSRPPPPPPQHHAQNTRAQPQKSAAHASPAVRAHRGQSGFDGPSKAARAASANPASKVGAPGSSFTAKGTGYIPSSSNTKREGGKLDRQDQPVHTLQDFLSGKSDTVTVAMDKKAAPYDTKLQIKELDQKYAAQLQKLGKDHIDFRVRDTGGDFKGTGTSRMDIAVDNWTQSQDTTLNGQLTATVVQ
jgi:hypothetical protein